MFFAGTLQEGIAAALQQSKYVVCFVTDEGQESQQWESDFLVDDHVRDALGAEAITLRLVAGSEEAGYLEALFPVPRKPTLVVIKNAELKEYIAAGTARDELTKRLGTALGAGQAPAASAAPPAAPASRMADRPVEAESQGEPYGDAGAAAPPASNSSGAATPSSSEERAAGVQALLAERAKRLEADKKAREAAAKAEREKRARERREAAQRDGGEQPPASSPNVTAAESSYAQMLRRKKQDEKDERQRILRRIEDDKKERREREAQEKQARLLLAATADPDASAAPAAAAAAASSTPAEPPIPLRRPGGGPVCNLQVRLFDGSTLRGRFQRDDTLGRQVRAWVDTERTDGDGPYTFRIVLTPLPNKAVEPGEEAEPLGDLGLAPSATLVLVPALRVASAYAHGGGLAARGLAFVYAWLAFFFSPLGLLLRPRGGGGDEAQRGVQLDRLDARGQRQRIRAFENADDQRRDQQLYNGNSLNFEPRRDEDDEAGG